MAVKKPPKVKLNPIKRIRDAVRYQKPLQKINYEEWKQIEDRAAQAELFLNDENELYKTMVADLEEAQRVILENRIHEVKEVRFFGEIQKIFTTDKQEQINELVGQYKYIKSFLAEMKTWIDFKRELEKKEGDGQILIQRDERQQI
jgi:hypothetical protein